MSPLLSWIKLPKSLKGLFIGFCVGVGCTTPHSREYSSSLPPQEEHAPLVLPSASPVKISLPANPSPSFQQVPRTVLALWDSQMDSDIFFTETHRLLEMPLNYLGLKVEYCDVHKPLPEVAERKDVVGVVSYLHAGVDYTHIEEFLRWQIAVINAGKKIALFGEYTANTASGLLEDFWSAMGLYVSGSWQAFPYQYQVAFYDPIIVPFESALPKPLASFPLIKAIDPEAKVHLRVSAPASPASDLIVTTAAGGFVETSYIAKQLEGGLYKAWYVNPFSFLRCALSLPVMPIPDPSTLAGRRVYFSHIDGDGWTNDSWAVSGKAQHPSLSATVIQETIIRPFPDLPVTVGPIAANVDPAWGGDKDAQEGAKELFKLPQVEMGCHTFSHPFDWPFFKKYTVSKEEPYLKRYSGPTWKKRKKTIGRHQTFYQLEETSELLGGNLRYFTPRAYAAEPFNLDQEITGAINEVNLFAPVDKRVAVYQWSGNALPWEAAIALTAEDGVYNINGGDSRYDFTYPSYTYVSPLTRSLGNQTQVYTCSSNENLYTELWTKDYYGFVNLPTTWKYTETPLRLKAMNLYYHMYSGERTASLYALKRNVMYARSQPLHPVKASDYCAAVDGFRSVQIFTEEPNCWQVSNRGGLHNFRFDEATFLGVDFRKARGVVGQRHFQGSLYVYCDKAEPVPVIALHTIEESFQEPVASVPYLIESSWDVSDLFVTQTKAQCLVGGFGEGFMRWKVPQNGIYEVKTPGQTLQVSSDHHEVIFILPPTEYALRLDMVWLAERGR